MEYLKSHLRQSKVSIYQKRPQISNQLSLKKFLQLIFFFYFISFDLYIIHPTAFSLNLSIVRIYVYKKALINNFINLFKIMPNLNKCRLHFSIIFNFKIIFSNRYRISWALFGHQPFICHYRNPAKSMCLKSHQHYTIANQEYNVETASVGELVYLLQKLYSNSHQDTQWRTSHRTSTHQHINTWLRFTYYFINW